ncbi:MAG: hypothetical protein Q7J68_05095 [Thermoplasmata archaeon]|nr:hypothetical protein [Thermoplasmata archaeon]
MKFDTITSDFKRNKPANINPRNEQDLIDTISVCFITPFRTHSQSDFRAGEGVFLFTEYFSLQPEPAQKIIKKNTRLQTSRTRCSGLAMRLLMSGCLKALYLRFKTIISDSESHKPAYIRSLQRTRLKQHHFVITSIRNRTHRPLDFRASESYSSFVFV